MGIPASIASARKNIAHNLDIYHDALIEKTWLASSKKCYHGDPENTDVCCSLAFDLIQKGTTLNIVCLMTLLTSPFEMIEIGLLLLWIVTFRQKMKSPL